MHGAAFLLLQGGAKKISGWGMAGAGQRRGREQNSWGEVGRGNDQTLLGWGKKTINQKVSVRVSALLSDPGPIIVYTCHSLINSLTHKKSKTSDGW